MKKNDLLSNIIEHTDLNEPKEVLASLDRLFELKTEGQVSSPVKSLDTLDEGIVFQSKVSTLHNKCNDIKELTGNTDKDQVWENLPKKNTTNKLIKTSWKLTEALTSNTLKEPTSNCLTKKNSSFQTWDKKTTMLASLITKKFLVYAKPLKLPPPVSKGSESYSDSAIQKAISTLEEALINKNFNILDIEQVSGETKTKGIVESGFFRIKLKEPKTPLRLFVYGEYIYKDTRDSLKCHFNLRDLVELRFRYEETYEDFKEKHSKRSVKSSSTPNWTDEGMVDGKWGSSASGLMFICNDKVLLLKRAPWTTDPKQWGIAGGAIPVDTATGKKKDAFLSAQTEATEELGDLGTFKQVKSCVFKEGDFTYTTFLCETPVESKYTLNNEHTEYAWVPLTEVAGLPDLHKGVVFALKQFGLWKKDIIEPKQVIKAANATMRIWRHVNDLYPTLSNPYFIGDGVLGEGTYFRPEQYAPISQYLKLKPNWTKDLEDNYHDPKYWELFTEYEAYFKNMVHLKDENTEQLWSDEFIGKKNNPLKVGKFECYAVGPFAKRKGFDAVLVTGKDVDGGNQVLIPKGSRPSIKTLSHILNFKDVKFARKLAKHLALKVSGSKVWFSESRSKDVSKFIKEHFELKKEVDAALWVDDLGGGLADDKTPADFDPEALAKGVEIEMEHTKDRKLATEIAMDHLVEDPKYYIKLEKYVEPKVTSSFKINETSTKGLKVTLDIKEFNAEESNPDLNPISEDFTVVAYINNKKVGYVQCYHGGGRLYAFEAFVAKKYRRKGIATLMYNYAQEVSGKHIYPHSFAPDNYEPTTSEEAKLFWKNRADYTFEHEDDEDEDDEVTASTPKDFDAAWEIYVTKYEQGDYVGYLKPTEEFKVSLKGDLESFKLDYIYRAIRLDTLLDLDFSHLGIFWTNKIDKAVAYFADKNKPVLVRITAALQRQSDVDWLGTIEQRMNLQYTGEDEVRLLEGAELKLIKLELWEGEKFEELDLPVPSKVYASLQDQGISFNLKQFLTKRIQASVQNLDTQDEYITSEVEHELLPIEYTKESSINADKDTTWKQDQLKLSTRLKNPLLKSSLNISNKTEISLSKLSGKTLTTASLTALKNITEIKQGLLPSQLAQLNSLDSQAVQHFVYNFRPFLNTATLSSQRPTQDGTIFRWRVELNKDLYVLVDCFIPEPWGTSDSIIYSHVILNGVIAHQSNTLITNGLTNSSKGPIKILVTKDRNQLIYVLNTYTSNFAFLDQGPAYVNKFSSFAIYDNEIVGYASFSDVDGFLVAQNFEVLEQYRRQGIGTKLYQAMEEETGKKIKPSDNQTEVAKKFWEKQNRAFGGSKDLPQSSKDYLKYGRKLALITEPKKVEAKVFKNTLNKKQLAKYWYETAYDYAPSAGELEEYVDMVERNFGENVNSWVLTEISLDKIKTHHEGHDASERYIKDYAAQKEKGSNFPPIIVKPQGTNYVTVNGQHRVKAAQLLGEKSILAYVPSLKNLTKSNLDSFEQSYLQEGFVKVFTSLKDFSFYIKEKSEKFWAPKDDSRGLSVDVVESHPDRVKGVRLSVSVLALNLENKEVVGDVTFIGYPEIYGNQLAAYDVFIEDKYRGLGIATEFYKIIKAKGYKIVPSSQQTSSGKKLWEKLRQEQIVSTQIQNKIEASGGGIEWQEVWKEQDRIERLNSAPWRSKEGEWPDDRDYEGRAKKPTDYQQYDWELDYVPLDKLKWGSLDFKQPIWTEGYSKPTKVPFTEEMYESLFDASGKIKKNLTSEQDTFVDKWSDEIQAREYAKLNSTPPPIIVVLDTDGFYKVWNGRHRVRSEILKGKSEIKAFIGSPKDPDIGPDYIDVVETSINTTKEDLEELGYSFKKNIEVNYGKEFLTLDCYFKGVKVGQLECAPSASNPKVLKPLEVKVDPLHRRQGIASAMYKMAEEYFGLPFGDTLSRSPEGVKFRKSWDKR